MICKNCKRIIPDGRNFCPYCGSKIELIQESNERKENSDANDSVRKPVVNTYESDTRIERPQTETKKSEVNQIRKKDIRNTAIISVLATLLCCSLFFIVYQIMNKPNSDTVITNTVEEDAAVPDSEKAVSDDATVVPDTEAVVQEQEKNTQAQAEETAAAKETSKTDEAHTNDNKPVSDNTSTSGESHTKNDQAKAGPNIDVSSIEIPRNYFVYDGHSYGIYDANRYDLTSYEEVKRFCRDQSGYLAVINDINENDELFSFVSNNSAVTAFFGYSDEKNESEWKWANGYSSFANWTKNDRENQPDNGSGYGGDEDYAEFNYERDTNSANDGTWNDASFMNNTSFFICEWDCDLGMY